MTPSRYARDKIRSHPMSTPEQRNRDRLQNRARLARIDAELRLNRRTVAERRASLELKAQLETQTLLLTVKYGTPASRIRHP